MCYTNKPNIFPYISVNSHGKFPTLEIPRILQPCSQKQKHCSYFLWFYAQNKLSSLTPRSWEWQRVILAAAAITTGVAPSLQIKEDGGWLLGTARAGAPQSSSLNGKLQSESWCCSLRRGVSTSHMQTHWTGGIYVPAQTGIRSHNTSHCSQKTIQSDTFLLWKLRLNKTKQKLWMRQNSVGSARWIPPLWLKQTAFHEKSNQLNYRGGG